MRRLRGIRHREMRKGFVKFALQRPYTPMTLLHPPRVRARGPRWRPQRQPKPGSRARSQIGGHDRPGPAEKRQWVGLHPRVTLGQQFGETMSALRNQNVDRIGAAGRRFSTP
jgi:hypothetical protein